MTQVKLVKCKLKDKKKWLDWCKELKKRKKEVVETLENEGVVSESCFIDGDYIYYFVEAEDLEHAKKQSQGSKHKIDAEHKEAKKAIEKIETLEELFHFTSSRTHQD